MRRYVLALISLVVFAPSFLVAQSFIEIKTPLFTVVTDAGEPKGRELAEHFEQLRAGFGLFFNKDQVSLPLPLTIVAFGNARDFQQFVPKFTDKNRAPWQGTLRTGEDQTFIAFNISQATDGRRGTAALSGIEFADREFTKLLLNGNLLPAPRWYDDGLAEYCSAIKVTNKQIIFGMPRPDLLAVLQTQPWLRLVQLFGPAPAAPGDWEAERRTIYYAQSWMTIHYLMANHLGRELNTFVDLLRIQHLETQEAIRRAFGVEPRSFENAVRNYFTLHTSEYKMALPADFGRVSFEVRKISETDWLATWADLHYHSARDHDLGVELYNKALAAVPAGAGANRGMAYALLQRNEFDKAEAYLQRARAADPADARTYYFLALLESKRSKLPNAKPVDPAVVKQHLQKAIQFNPNYADAYQLLSWAEAESKDVEAARAASEKAATLNPRNDTFALTSAQFDLQARKYEKARPVLERLQGSDQPEIARFAHEALSSIGPRKQETSAHEALSSIGPRKQETSAHATRQQITAPQWQPKETEAETQPQEKQPAAAAPAVIEPPQQNIRFLKGELVSVDCSKSPLVSITIAAKGKTWVMYAPDVQKLMLIGVENFSCNWTNKAASVNYRWKPDGRGEMVTLEID